MNYFHTYTKKVYVGNLEREPSDITIGGLFGHEAKRPGTF